MATKADFGVLTRSPLHFLALGFGSGLSPFAPGTAGSMAAIPVLLVLGFGPVWLYPAVLALVIVIGFPICGRVAEDLGVPDHSAIVWDEIAGMMLTLLFIPLSLNSIILGFLLFRLLDVVKPWPIRYFDRRVKGGWGIMLDDIVAGLFANVVLQILVVNSLI